MGKLVFISVVVAAVWREDCQLEEKDSCNKGAGPESPPKRCPAQKPGSWFRGYYDPWRRTSLHQRSEGYYFANGINLSPDKRHIYVVDVLDHSVHVLEWKEDNALFSVKSVDVG